MIMRGVRLISFGRNGRTIVNRLPFPISLSTLIVPPYEVTMRLHVANPNPVPRFFEVKNGRKILSRLSGWMPWPVSDTEITTDPPEAVELKVVSVTMRP